MSDEMLTIDEVAELVQIHAETVQSWVHRGLPATQQSDGTVRIRRADLDAFLQQEGQGTARDAAEA